MPNGSSIEVMLNGIHIKLPERVQQNIMGLLANELVSCWTMPSVRV